MKVLIVNKFLYPRGGDVICALATGKLLESRGHQVIFWGMDHPGNPEYPKKNLFIDHVDFDSAKGFSNKLRIAGNVLYSREAKQKIARLIEEEKPDIAHLHNFAHQISPSILHVLQNHKVPAVMTMHDYKLVCPAYTMSRRGEYCDKCRNGRYYHCLSNKCIKNSFAKSLLGSIEMYLHHNILNIYDIIRCFIAPSQFMMKLIKKMGFTGNVVYLPNFVEFEDLKPSHDSREKSIVYFGRLSPEKGLNTLIKAMTGVNGVFLKIIGDGPIKSDLERQVKTETLTNIRFLGYRSGGELKEEIRKSLFVVVPSECQENCPRAILEAFSLGRPVIGANIGGIPELIKEGETGYLFKSGEALDLREKIEMIAAQPERIIAMGKKARELVENTFDPTRHYTGLMNLYESAMKEAK